jgi:hypothetical protein
VQEIKNGRLAMVGILGLLFQAAKTNEGIISQLSGAFVLPDAVQSVGAFPHSDQPSYRGLPLPYLGFGPSLPRAVSRLWVEVDINKYI